MLSASELLNKIQAKARASMECTGAVRNKNAHRSTLQIVAAVRIEGTEQKSSSGSSLYRVFVVAFACFGSLISAIA